MPFWDDANLSSLPDLSGRLMLVDVFDKPVRFRLEMLASNSKSSTAVMSSANSWMKSMPVVRCTT